jgi:Pyruvate/2-oxoacid:ferredoxin oxidoreductase delta subunit
MPWQNVVCMSCQSVCPTKAILFDERGRPTVHPTNCNGCGICVAPCPVDALSVVPENPKPGSSGRRG